MIKYRSGKTPLIKVEEFSLKFGLKNLLVKDESKNPFATWKDRRSEMIVKIAKKKHADKLCLITAGNAGFSVAKFADQSKIKVVSVVDLHLPGSIKIILQKACYKVREIDLSKKMLNSRDIISLARENEREIILDATNGFEEAYESIVKEIKNSNPHFLICPMGSGEAFVGLYQGIKKYNLKTKLIGVRPKSNPSIADKLPTSWMLYKEKIQVALRQGNAVIELTEEEIKNAYLYAKNHIECEPSSAVVFAAFDKLDFNKNDKIIVINSGKGLA